jgi:hypothetical protein
MLLSTVPLPLSWLKLYSKGCSRALLLPPKVAQDSLTEKLMVVGVFLGAKINIGARSLQLDVERMEL